MALSPASSFSLQSGDKIFQVHQKRAEQAARIDANKDNKLEDKEIVDYLEKNGDLCGHVSGEQHDHSRIVEDFKTHLQGKMPEALSSYQNYEQISERMDEWVK